ncbi:hypothetical protein AZH11_07280 [Pseudomonas simiae]|nr:hypothetical protein AZH11_07280 [Pseudomonas simiae]
MILAPVVIDGHSTVIEIARQRYPALEAVIQRLGDGRSLRHKLPLGDHPGMKCVDDRRCFFLSVIGMLTRHRIGSVHVRHILFEGGIIILRRPDLALIPARVVTRFVVRAACHFLLRNIAWGTLINIHAASPFKRSEYPCLNMVVGRLQ